MTQTTLRTLTTGLSLVVFLGLSACEITDPLQDVSLRIAVEDVPVQLGSAASVAVTAERPVANTSSVQNDFDVTSVEELREIKLEPSYFTYSPSAGKTGGTDDSGTIDVFLFLGGVPVPGTPVHVTIENDVVVSVSPSSISFLGTDVTLDEAGIAAFLSTLPEDEQPELDDWESMTIDQVIDEINAALASSTFPFTIGTQTTGDINGDLSLDQFDVSALVTQD